jgi:hypothetical protein
VTLLWAVPVVAAAVATVLVAARSRALEDEVVGLVREVRRLRDIRAPLAAVRTAADETDDLVVAFRAQHPIEPDGPDDTPGGARGHADPAAPGEG